MNSNVYMGEQIPNDYILTLTGNSVNEQPDSGVSNAFDGDTGTTWSSDSGSINDVSFEINNINSYISKIYFDSGYDYWGSTSEFFLEIYIKTGSTDDYFSIDNYEYDDLESDYLYDLGRYITDIKFTFFSVDDFGYKRRFIREMRLYKYYSDLTVSGDITANSISPFTGTHIYKTDSTELSNGDTVYLKTPNIIDKTYKSGQTDVVGIVNNIKDDDVYVAAVGDNNTNMLKGFKVTDEGGEIKPGTLLCSSSTPGYLMAQPDDIIRSMTVGKAMEDVEFNEDGLAHGIYGFIYSG
jgi:hypothetical protein